MLIKQEVQDGNIFFSSARPEIQVKINQEFEYINKEDASHLAFSNRGGNYSTGVSVEEFLFQKIKNKNQVILIEISTISSPRWSFSPTLYDTEGSFDSGSIIIKERTFQYIIYYFINNRDIFLAKDFGTIPGASNDVKFEIIYLEKLEDTIYYYSEEDEFNSKIKEYLPKFNENCEKAFQIL